MSDLKEITVQVDNNPFALNGRREVPGTSMQIATSRQAQEVQAAMVVAKRFPRDESEAWTRIIKACTRKGLAEQAMYAYPKGGTTVTGPSIRMAETLAQNWGNIDFGIIELEKRDGESTVMAFCWDLETNTRQTKIFQVSHEIALKNGQKKVLTDPRDIYEIAANQGARRLRACILGIIPGDIVDAAVTECEKTLKGNNVMPLIDRVRKMALVFQEEHQVSIQMLEKRLGHKLDATNEQELVNLRKIYTSLKDAASKREQWFDLTDSTVAPEGLPKTTPQRAAASPDVTTAPVVPVGNEGQADSEQPAPTPATPVVPDVIGEKKKTRADLLAEIRGKLERDGTSEAEFVGALAKRGTVSAGSALKSLASDLLSDALADYAALINEI